MDNYLFALAKFYQVFWADWEHKQTNTENSHWFFHSPKITDNQMDKMYRKSGKNTIKLLALFCILTLIISLEIGEKYEFFDLHTSNKIPK